MAGTRWSRPQSHQYNAVEALELQLTVKTHPSLGLGVVRIMVENWAEAGINVRIQTLPASVFLGALGRVSIPLHGLGRRPLGMVLRSLAYRIGASWNESSFSNARFDELWTGTGEVIGPGNCQVAMGRLMSGLREVGPAVEPFFMQVAMAFNKRVKSMMMYSANCLFLGRMGIET